MFPRRLHLKFGLEWPSGLREKKCLKIIVINMYIAPGQGQKTPWGTIFFLKTIKLLLMWSFAASVSILITL